jgi:glycosyltransferase involved in cell wall biosynthesis
MPLLDELEGEAEEARAVNTIRRDGRRLIGSNTDVVGIRAALTQVGIEPSGARVVVLGAGTLADAARARAEEAGLDWRALSMPGSGFAGMIVERDVEALLARAPAAPRVTPLAARLAAELGVDGRFVLAGWSDDPAGWLRSFDVLALPSRTEGLPLAAVEAMLAGVPVVATAVGSVPEAVRDGETGLLVPPEDPHALAAALRRVLEDGELRRRLVEAGRALAEERFTPAAAARAYEELYASLTRRRVTGTDAGALSVR